jgi:hypothetical protein
MRVHVGINSSKDKICSRSKLVARTVDAIVPPAWNTTRLKKLSKIGMHMACSRYLKVMKRSIKKLWKEISKE